MSGRDDFAIEKAKLNGKNAAHTMVNDLVKLDVPPEEVRAAIHELTKHAEDMAKLALGQREAAKLIKNAERGPNTPQVR
jgi:hypothetical protein